jgi:hypothetical protein
MRIILRASPSGSSTLSVSMSVAVPSSISPPWSVTAHIRSITDRSSRLPAMAELSKVKRLRPKVD